MTTEGFFLTPEERAAVVVGLTMYARATKSRWGSVTFSRADITGLQIFDEVPTLESEDAQKLANKIEERIYG